MILGPMNNNFMMPMYQKPMPVSAGKVYPADQPMVSDLKLISLNFFHKNLLFLGV